MPAEASWSGDWCEKIIEAGCVIKVSVPPRLTAEVHSRTFRNTV
jgi:hypothetical protein